MRTTRGNEWSSSTLGQMLKSPKLRGCRSHNGELHRGDWEPILSESEHLALVEVLSDPRRISTRRSGLRHLLTGTAVCGVCGGPLKWMVLVTKAGKRFPRYQCVKAPGAVNCGKVAVTMASLDEHVRTRLLAHLADGARQDPDPVEEGERQRLAALADEDRRALEELTQARFFHRSISDGEYVVTRKALTERLAGTESELAHLDRPADVELPETYDELEAWWEAAEVTERRSALRREVERVVIHPARHRGGNVFDARRAEIAWR